MARAAWFFAVPDEGAVPERLQALFAKARERLGFVPNVFRSYSVRPERFSAWFAHYKQLHEPTENLDAADREMIAVVVSAWNRCTYCIVAHGQALRAALVARGLDAAAAQVQADYVATNWRHAELDDRRSAICEFAERLTAEPHRSSEADLQVLADAGLSRDEVWDVVEIAAMYNFTNRMALALGQLPNEEYHDLEASVGSASMDDKSILAHIDELVEEEKQLRAGHHGLDNAGRARLQTIEQHLDQAWDLLRQRRAREELGESPDSATQRSVNEVEGYLQ